MPLIARAGQKSEFSPAPAGAHQGVCVDVVDLGMVEQTFEGHTSKRHMCRIVWELSTKMDDGRPFLQFARFTVSLHERAALRKCLESWRGRPFTDAELKGFDVESVIGANCILNIVHKPNSKGGVWANVASVSPILPGIMQPMKASGDYTRVKDREGYMAPEQRDPGSDDELPPVEAYDENEAAPDADVPF